MQFDTADELGAAIIQVCRITGRSASWAQDIISKSSEVMLQDPYLLKHLAKMDDAAGDVSSVNGRSSTGHGEGDFADTDASVRSHYIDFSQVDEDVPAGATPPRCAYPTLHDVEAEEQAERRCIAEGRVPDTEMTARCYLKHAHEGHHRAWASPYGEFWWDDSAGSVDEGA